MAELGAKRAVQSVDAGRLFDAVRRGRAITVDLRSPAEFVQDHVPGAVNVPLFDDVERAVIGTLYKQRSPENAFEEARATAGGKIQGIAARIAEVAGWEAPPGDLAARVERMTAGGMGRLESELEVRETEALPEGAVVLHCWRGGLRSRSVVALLRELGFDRAFGLAGGYKAWRGHVRAYLERWEAPAVFVLRGLTGSGKTLVLRELERLRPGWTVDLEGCAGHRSSILGMVGLEPCSQKTFETRLFARLASGFEGPCVFEGESRKVGDAILPPRVWRALDGGCNLKLEAPTARRVDVLIADYLARDENRAALRGQLPFLEERLGPRKWAGRLVALLDDQRERELVEVLLEHYYDPLYRHSETGRSYAATFDATDPAECAAALATWIESR